ncbi:DedA family protein [Leucobacter sp. M11]|uniref:DedA family protein n=1 Tax=Leucobacter sp. M11 TaxID=2993565 RepID=UPI002D7F67FA|nr:DedA family protein [Leucobacter sp. M11]MEB4615701.1 DedA family protein [Leucobacter sp. M11]
MLSTALIPWLDPNTLIEGFGAYALLGVCLIVFAETGLLVGFLLPGDTLLLITGVLTFSGVIDVPIVWVCIAIAASAFLGGEVGYLIGRRAGSSALSRRAGGFLGSDNLSRTQGFFDRFGGLAVILARFVPVVRTIAPVAAGAGRMPWGRYSLFNAVGALVWGAGLSLIGYLLGYIPPLRDFMVSYIDLILLGAIAVTVIPTAWHAIRAARRARSAPANPVAEYPAQPAAPTP